jgi:glycosyltransferase involved in cell wall biosynthesis
MPRTILLVAHLAPPSPLSAARRSAGFAKHLGRRGHRVVVLTSKLSGDGPVEGAARVVRAGDLMTTRLNWRRGSFDALQGTAQGAAPPPSRLEHVVVPDLALVSWIPFALPRALRLARSERFDVVWTTGPPQTTHLIGLALRRLHGIPWVADVRDGWRFERHHTEFPLAAQRRLDGWLERKLIGGADALTAISEPLARDARERLGQPRAVCLSNGFDLDELEPLAGSPPDGVLDPHRHSLLFTGRIGYVGRSPTPLLAGLRALRDTDPEAAAKLEVLFAGPLRDDERAEIEAPDLAGLVRTLGSFDRETTMRLQRAADALLLLTTDQASETGQKLYEYLAADRPVFVVGDRTEAARVVEAAGAGLAVPLRDPAAIAAGLARVARGEVSGGDGSIARRFDYSVLAEELEQQLELAIAGSS